MAGPGIKGESLNRTKTDKEKFEIARTKSPDDPLTAQQERYCQIAAVPDADGNYPFKYVAYLEAFNCNIKTAKKMSAILNQQPNIQKRIAMLRKAYWEKYQTDLADIPIVQQRERLLAKNERWMLLRQVIQERAEQSFEETPGEGTGLFARQEKTTQFGTEIIYKVDKTVLDSINALENDVAKELGQLKGGEEDPNAAKINVVQFILPHNGRDEAITVEAQDVPAVGEILMEASENS